MKWLLGCSKNIIIHCFDGYTQPSHMTYSLSQSFLHLYSNILTVLYQLRILRTSTSVGFFFFINGNFVAPGQVPFCAKNKNKKKTMHTTDIKSRTIIISSNLLFLLIHSTGVGELGSKVKTAWARLEQSS